MNLIMGWYLCSLIGQLCELSRELFTELARFMPSHGEDTRKAAFYEKTGRE